MTTLVGHTHVRTQFRTLMQTQKLPHGIILTGPSGVGKSLIARELSQTILCEDEKNAPCKTCKSCKLASSLQHPDQYILNSQDRETVDSDSMRALLHSLSFRSFSGKARVVILEDSERLPILSANILLKSLEEPPPNTYFLLTTSQASLLPRTVLSRLHRWNIDLLSNEEVSTIIQELYPKISAETNQLWTTLCSGSLEMISSLSQAEEEFSEFESLLIGLGQKKIAPLVVFLHKRAKDKAELPLTLALLRSLLRREALRESPHQAAYAEALMNILASERLIFDRNLQASAVLGTALALPFFGTSTTPKIIDDALFSAS